MNVVDLAAFPARSRKGNHHLHPGAPLVPRPPSAPPIQFRTATVALDAACSTRSAADDTSLLAEPHRPARHDCATLPNRRAADK